MKRQENIAVMVTAYDLVIPVLLLFFATDLFYIEHLVPNLNI